MRISIKAAIGKLRRTMASQGNAYTYGLKGSLGSGKTYLLKRLLSVISAEFGEQVHSPTFNLCNIYHWSGFEVHHYDLYRIESVEDLYDIGIMESIENNQIFTFIEWIDLFPELIQCCDEIITISEDNKKLRRYQIESVSENLKTARQQ